MSDVNANIGVNIDSSQALAELKRLQRQISEFNLSVIKSNEVAAQAQKSLQRNFINSVNAIGSFSAELRTVNTTAESFTKALENNKLSMREYFRYAAASTKTFGKNYKSELDTIGKVAEERVKTLQTQYIKLGRDANGAMKAIAIRPLTLDMNDLATQTAITAQKQALFNQLVKQGSTQLLNFGKNTQWAGRQLMVGFTLPLVAFGAAASKSFQQLETEVIKFRKVYGDLGTNQQETEAALKNIQALADGYTKYGVEVSKTVGLASQAAAAGFQGASLMAQTDAATKLSILGQIEQQQALETTISLQNAFKISSEELASTIDFLNAVENQTVTSLDDITTAIPKVAPVINSLGGDVKDLAFFLTAMKEGGVNASEGANALKSGLASLINPTNKAKGMLEGMGISIDNIVNKNRGNLKATVIEFATALDKLDPLARARAIETMFGKFQFARISTLLANVIDQGNQASRVLDLASQSTSQLASLTEKELGITAQSALVRFQGAMAKLKASLAPVGEVFMKALTPVIEFVSRILDKFNNLSEGTKKFIAITVGVIGGLGPIVLMTFGLLANGIANIIKLFMTLRNGYQRLTGQSSNLTEQTQYLTNEQLDAAAAAHSLEQSHAKLIQTFNVEAGEVNKLRVAYQEALAAGASFALMNPGMMKAPRVSKFADGGVVVSGPGGPKDDLVPANLSNGEVVLSVNTVKKNPSLVSALLSGRRIGIPGYKDDPGTIVGGSELIARGRNAAVTRGLQTQVDVPGSYDVSHFGGKFKKTGQEILDLIAGRDDTYARKIRSMVNSFGDGLTRQFTVFDDSVVAQFTELNREMKNVGYTTVEKARNALTNPELAPVRDIELQRRLTESLDGKPAIMSIEEFGVINKELTAEVTKRFDALGNQVIITSDELDLLLRESYEAIAETNKDVKTAYTDMKQIRTVTDPNTQSRLPLSDDSYVVSKKKGRFARGMERIFGDNVPYPANARFGIKKQVADSLGISLKEAKLIYKQLSDEAKLTLFRMKDDLEKFVPEFVKQAELAGIKIGEGAIVGVAKGAKTASPSTATRQTAKDIIAGLRNELAAQEAAVRQSGIKVGQIAVNAVDVGAANQLKKKSIVPGAQGSLGISDIGSVIIASELSGLLNNDSIAAGLPEGFTPTSGISDKMIGPLTRNQARLAAIKAAMKPKLGIGAGGFKTSMGLMAGSMALSAMPDFTNKALLQSTVNLAAMGAIFGPWGAAAGAAVGLVSSAVTKLIEKQKHLKEIAASTLKTTGEEFEILGGKVVDAGLKLQNVGVYIKGITSSFGGLNAEMQRFVDMVNNLPQDNPLKLFIEGLKTEDKPGLIDKIQTRITSEISLGNIQAEQAQKYTMAYLAAAGRANEFNDVWKKISLSVVNTTKATKASFDGLFTDIADEIIEGNLRISLGMEGWRGKVFSVGKNRELADYKGLSQDLKNVADQMLNFAGIMSNGSLDLQDFNNRLAGLRGTGLDSAIGIDALAVAIANTKDQDAINTFNQIRASLEGITGQAASAADAIILMTISSMGAMDDLKIWAAKNAKSMPGVNPMDLAQTSYMSPEVFKKYWETTGKSAYEAYYKEQKKIRDELFGGGSGGGATDGLSAASKKYIEILNKEILALENKLKVQKDINDETQRAIDLASKQQDLDQKIAEAKMSGNYIQAAILQQQKINNVVAYNQESTYNEQQNQLDALKTRLAEIEKGGKLTPQEKAKIGIRRADGGPIGHYDEGAHVRGPGTSTSDSIPAMLSDGEYVIKTKSVNDIKPENAALINQYGSEGLLQAASNILGQDVIHRANGGEVSKNGWLQKWAQNISGQPGAEMFGTAQLLRIIAGIGRKGDNLGAAQVPLAFLGTGIGSKIANMGFGKLAYALPNKLYQLRNQAKVKSMIKSGMWHGSQPVGYRGEEFLQGTNILEGAESYDPYYGMGFFSTTSKGEADSYAAGYNSLSNWGESFGSMNRVVGAPRGKYIDFTKGTNSLKWQDYSLAKALGVKRNGYLGNFMPENLGDIMNAEGMTGAIMNRVSSGRSPWDGSKWLAWSNPAGVITKEKYHKGGPVGHTHIPISAGATATTSTPATGLASDPRFGIDKLESQAFSDAILKEFNFAMKPFTPTKIKEDKQSGWSKNIRGVMDKIGKYILKPISPGGPIGFELARPFLDSTTNIFAGDARWNDFTNVGTQLAGTGAISGALRVPGKIKSGLVELSNNEKLASMLPKVDSIYTTKMIASLKSKIMGAESLDPYQASIIKALEQAKKGKFTPIADLNKVDYNVLLKEARSLQPKRDFVNIGGQDFVYNFTPADFSLYPPESQFKGAISNILKDPYGASEWVGPLHSLNISTPEGKSVASLTWDSLTGTIRMIQTGLGFQKLGIARWMNEYAGSITRLKHSKLRTPEGMAYSTKIGGIMPDKPFISSQVPMLQGFAEAFGLRPRKMTVPKSFPTTIGQGVDIADRTPQEIAAESERIKNQLKRIIQQGRDREAALGAWRNSLDRTYNSYPFGPGGQLEWDDELELLRLMKNPDKPAGTYYTSRTENQTHTPSQSEHGTDMPWLEDWNLGGRTSAATGGYIDSGKLIQHFVNGGKPKPFEWSALKAKKGSFKEDLNRIMQGPRGLYNTFIRPIIASGSRMINRPKNYGIKDSLYDAVNIGSLGLSSKAVAGKQVLSPLAEMAFEKATARQGVQVVDSRLPKFINNFMELGIIKPTKVKARADEFLTEYARWAKTPWADSPEILKGLPNQTARFYSPDQLNILSKIKDGKRLGKIKGLFSGIKDFMMGKANPTAYHSSGITRMPTTGHGSGFDTLIHELGHRNLFLSGGTEMLAKQLGFPKAFHSPMTEAYAQMFEHWLSAGIKAKAPAYSGILSIPSPFEGGGFYSHGSSTLAGKMLDQLFHTAPGVTKERNYQSGPEWLRYFGATVERLSKTSFKSKELNLDPVRRMSFLPMASVQNAADLAKVVEKTFTSPFENKMWAQLFSGLDGRLKRTPEHIAQGWKFFDALKTIAPNVDSFMATTMGMGPTEIVALVRRIAQQSKMNMGGLAVPKFHSWNGPIPGPYGQELGAVLKSGTEGVYQEDYMNRLRRDANINNSTTSNSNAVYNIDMTINGGGANANEIANQVMMKIKNISDKNNTSNKVVF